MIKGKIELYKYSESSEGFPIKIALSEGRTKRTRRITTGYYSFPEHWNDDQNMPLPSHPSYQQLMVDYFDWQKKLFTVIPEANREQWTLDKTVTVFKTYGQKFNVFEFVKTLSLSERNLELYITCLNSLEKFVGHLEFDKLDHLTVKRYIDVCKRI